MKLVDAYEKIASSTWRPFSDSFACLGPLFLMCFVQCLSKWMSNMEFIINIWILQFPGEYEIFWFHEENETIETITPNACVGVDKIETHVYASSMIPHQSCLKWLGLDLNMESAKSRILVFVTIPCLDCSMLNCNCDKFFMESICLCSAAIVMSFLWSLLAARASKLIQAYGPIRGPLFNCLSVGSQVILNGRAWGKDWAIMLGSFSRSARLM